jgi:hypothetical protein
MGVDDIGGLGCSAQISCRARRPTVDGHLTRTAKEPCQQSLARSTLAPCLGYTPRRREDPVAATPCCFDERGDVTVASVEGDEPASVEDQTHSGRTGTSLAGSVEQTVCLGDLGIAERAELLLPGGDGLPESLETQTVPSGLCEPGGDALMPLDSSGPNCFSQLEVERHAHLLDTHEPILPWKVLPE